jgi:hypothetical protein
MTLDSHKIHTFDDEDILRYMYAEMSEEETSIFDDALVSNADLQTRYEELLACAALLVEATTNDFSDAIIDTILMQSTGKLAWRELFLSRATIPVLR